MGFGCQTYSDYHGDTIWRYHPGDTTLKWPYALIGIWRLARLAPKNPISDALWYTNIQGGASGHDSVQLVRL